MIDDPTQPAGYEPEPSLPVRQDRSGPPARDARSRAAATMDTGLLRTPARRSVRRSATRRRVVLLLAVLGGLACVSVLLFVLAMRHSLQRNLPQLDGTASVHGLEQPVTVTRNRSGVPDITAATMHDLLFAQGYTTAADRMWQMDALRRHASGELAEILGSSMIRHDRLQRYLQLRAAADRAVQALPADQLAQLQAYADGVNAWLRTHGDALPVEFALLHYKPAPWVPRDSLLVSLIMFQDLNTEFPEKLAREALSAHLPAELLPDMYPTSSWHDHPPGEIEPDLTTPREEIQQTPLDPSQSRLRPPAAATRGSVPVKSLLAAEAFLPHPSCEGCRSGSNNWAVSGARTASGGVLVSNDMHLQLSVPDAWYSAGLHVRDGSLDVTGVTLPGVPFVIVGRNAHVAWGFTAEMGDVQDIVVEHLRGTGEQTEFERADGTWAPVVHQRERIRVRLGADVTLDVQLTAHSDGEATMLTPVISPLYAKENRALALEWSAFDPANVTAPFLAVNQAANGAALDAAFAHFGGPTLSLVWGDDAGHIGYHAIGRVPIRGAMVVHPALRLPEAAPAGGSALPANGDMQSSDASDAPPPVPQALQPGAAANDGQLASPLVAIAPFAQSRSYTIGSPVPVVPVDVLDANGAWSGYVPYDKLPAVTDPASGVVATANARITPDNYPYQLAADWATGYRIERIAHVLYGTHGMTGDNALALEMDVHSTIDQTLAQRLAYSIDHASSAALGSHKARLQQAANILRTWHGEVTPDAAAPEIVEAFRTAAWPALLLPQLRAHDTSLSRHDAEELAALYTWSESLYALEELLEFQPKRWLANGDTWNDFIVRTLDKALDHAPADLGTWTWGTTHGIELQHPVLSAVPTLRELLGVRTGTGLHVAGGDGTTVKQTGRHFGPSERFTADLGQPGSTTMTITTGESGNPASPWYLDQFPLWLHGSTLPQPLAGSTGALHTLQLMP